MRAPSWREPHPLSVDFFAAKGVLSALLDGLGLDWETRAAHSAPGFLHPGRGADVLVDGEQIGWLGEIHPSVASEWGFEDTVAGFEIDISAIEPPAAAQFRDLGTFPEVREDLAAVLGEGVSAAELLAVIRRSGSPLLAAADVFDVYRDETRLGPGNVSIAVRLAYRAPDRTLTDEEVARQRQFIVNAIARELNGSIRAGE